MTLDARLRAAASLVRPGRNVCDIGTDHGYLPVWLAEQEHEGRITASDVNEKPLDSARHTIEADGYSHRITLLRSDGLANIPAELAEDIVVAGMGGELIARILSDCPYVREADRHLILQPMTRADYLRRWLCGRGFEIVREVPAVDRGHCYSVLSCYYTGTAISSTPLFERVGRVPEEDTPAAFAYVEHELLRVRRIVGGREMSGAPTEDYRLLLRQLEETLTRMHANGEN